MMSLLMLSAPALAAIGCEDHISREQLSTSLDIARQAFAEEDQPVFDAALSEADFRFSCLRDPLNDRDAGVLHLVHGLDLWDPADPELALPYLHLYYLAFPPGDDSATGLPRGLTPAEEPVFRAVVPQLTELEIERDGELPPAARGRLQLNGQGADLRVPTNHPYLVQVATSDTVLANFLVEPGGEIPPYPRLRSVLLLGSGIAAVGAASSFYKGWDVANELRNWDPDQGIGRFGSETAYVESRQTRNHIFVLTGVGLSAATVVGLAGVGMTFIW